MGPNGTIKWKLKPPGLNTFFDLSITPSTVVSDSGCATTISSNLTFSPQMHDNGSFFRCEVTDMDGANIVSPLHAEEEFFVVPSKHFHRIKRAFETRTESFCFVGLETYCCTCNMLFNDKKNRCMYRRKGKFHVLVEWNVSVPWFHCMLSFLNILFCIFVL